jgi:CheY-like chemotaxis protein
MLRLTKMAATIGDTISILHLTDLHCGLEPTLWSAVEAEFLDDLQRLHDKAGGIDLILFTGDLTQRGTSREFNQLDEILQRLGAALGRMGSTPTLVAVPGNHDLMRPSLEERARLRETLDSVGEIRSELLNSSSDFNRAVHAAFAPYIAWRDALPFASSPMFRPGAIPGDFSTQVAVRTRRVGLVGLNTAFLQVADGFNDGELEVLREQLTAVCGDNADEWLRDSDLAVVLTHHAHHLLSESAQAEFQEHIYPPGRFVFHAFGHKHAPRALTERLGGARPRRYLQGTSMFGLAHFGEAKSQRIHGYSVVQFAPATGELRVYPRARLRNEQTLQHRIVPDHANFDLNDDSYVETTRNVATAARIHPAYGSAKLKEQSLLLAELIKKRDEARLTSRRTEDLDIEILRTRRRMREGGRLEPGDRLADGRYLLLRVLGQGGFATVWHAVDQSQNQDVAIKILHPQLSRDQSALDRFVRGARRTADLRHPAIVPVLDSVTHEEGWYFFTMPLFAAGDLRRSVLDGALSIGSALSALVHAADGVAYAHEQSLLHRDVTPSNMLLDRDGRALMADFDLVGGAGTTGGTRSGALGKFIYAAPEALYAPQHAKAPSDVFGLGMTGIFCCHQADLPAEALRETKAFIGALATSPHIKQVLRAATEWNINNRMGTASEFARNLRTALSTPPPRSATDGRGYRILVVDDEAFIRDIVADFLGMEGYEVLKASDAEGAVSAVSKTAIDVVFLDQKMPEKDGLQTLVEMRSIQPDLKVVIMTGFGTVEKAVTAMRAGARDYILKPFKVEEVVALALRYR